MKKIIKDKEILNIVFILRHNNVLIKTSYCKSLIRIDPIFTENLPFYQTKHGDLKREMTSLREEGGVVGMYIILCGDNMSLIKIK